MGSSYSSPNVAGTNIPTDVVPWTGPQVQYYSMQIQTTMSSHWEGFGSSIITSNIESCYHLVNQPYKENFELLSFYLVPCVNARRGMFTMGMDVPYEAIYSRQIFPDGRVSSQCKDFQLRIEKSQIVVSNVFKGLFTTNVEVTSDASDLHNKIFDVTQNMGGRLICIEVSGAMKGSARAVGAQLRNQMSPMPVAGNSFRPCAVGVDLFFHIPLNPSARRYTVQAISVQVPYLLKAGFGTINTTCNLDWTATMAQYLNCGWKLVEVFLDLGSQTRTTGFASCENIANSIWFFEKPTDCLNDSTPKFEGCVVPYSHTIEVSFHGSRAVTSWNNLLSQMGLSGWELACIIETPSMNRQGFRTMSVSLLFFFQRPVLSGAVAPPSNKGTAIGFESVAPPSDQPPPYYDVPKQ